MAERHLVLYTFFSSSSIHVSAFPCNLSHCIDASLFAPPAPLLYQTDRRSLQHTQYKLWVVKEHKEGLRWRVGPSGGGQREKCQRGDKDNTIWLQMIVPVISMGLGSHWNLSRAFLCQHRQSFYWANDDVEVELMWLLPLLLVSRGWPFYF